MHRAVCALCAVAGAGLLTGGAAVPRQAIAEARTAAKPAQAGEAAGAKAGATVAFAPVAASPAVWRNYTWRSWPRDEAWRRQQRYRNDPGGYAGPRWGRPLPPPPQGYTSRWHRTPPPRWNDRRAYSWNDGRRGYSRNYRDEDWRGGRRWVGAWPYPWRVR